MRVVFVVGPTASGKSAFALEAAAAVGGVIVNCDSVQVYEELDIGAAKPAPAELARVPHELFGFVRAPEVLTAGKFARAYEEKLQALSKSCPVAFTVGGTGFYFQAIEKGMPAFPASDAKVKTLIQAELERDGNQKTWERLNELDPAAAKKIAVNDGYRLVRALEIIRMTGRKVSELTLEHQESHPKFPYPLTKVGLMPTKESERARVAKRTEDMLKRGLVEETEALLAKGLADWQPLASVGYKETADYLRGIIKTREELKEKIVFATLYLAKRQRTWFQKDKEIAWFDPDAEGALEQFLRATAI